MKTSLRLSTLCTLLCALFLFSCSHSDTPVDKIVGILDQATQNTEKITNQYQLNDVGSIVSPQEIWNIINEYPDYELTKEDKDKLKKSYHKLMDAAYKKSCEFVTSDELKNLVKKQVDIVMAGIDTNIDNAKTLIQIRP